MENKIVRNCPRAVGYMAVLGGFLVHMTLGGIYTYDNMAPYIIDFMRNYTHGARNMSTTSFWLWIFDLTVFGFGSSMALGGFIEDKLGALLTILIGGWLMSASIAVCYWTIEAHLILFAVMHGLLAGIGAGIAYSVSMATPVEWFPQSKGLITGILVSGFGLGPLFFDYLQALYVGDGDSKITHTEEYSRVKISFLIVSGLFGTLQLFGATMVRRRTIEVEDESNPEVLLIPLFRPLSDLNVKPHKLIFERDFWIMWIGYSFNSSVAIMILTLHKAFGVRLHISGIKLTWVSEVADLCNGIGRILFGYLIDRISYKVLMSFVTATMSLLIGTFYLCSKIDVHHGGYSMYIVWVALLHLVLGGNYSVYPAMCVKSFGVKNFAGNYGILFTAFSFGAIVTSLFTFKLLEDSVRISDFLPPFAVGSGLSLLSFIVTQFFLGQLWVTRNHLGS